ncbi:hypothetical protein OG379_33405 [Streptomyces sp. NBC_01166]|uniref:hypothetical protein n=1 Tax=Streptomyces sp. NBC_01166 TaxID=2903755 RepID=UPI0038658D0C|nr:hypothetical protein OG379_33405 [Streptomyces sp. NBC_01166]
MRRSLRELVMAAGAAVAAIAFAAPVATAGVAAPTWTVGPNPAETFSAGSGTVRLQWGLDANLPTTCESSAARGNLATASGTANVQVGTVAPLTWSNCTSPFGPLYPAADTTTPWKLMANSYNAGVTKGYVSGVKLRMTMLTCSMTVSGRLATTYTNSTGELKVNDDSTYKLTVGTATPGCAGLAAVVDHWEYQALYSVTTPSGGTTKPAIVFTP